MSPIKNVTVLGAGVLGSQIAYQAAFHGYTVTSYDVTADAVAKAGDRFAILAGRYVADAVPDASDGHADATAENIRRTTDLADAVADADLVIEAAPENLTLKRDLYGRLAAVAPEKTIFATNSSTLLPSDIKDATGRPDRFLALHYANNVWIANTAEIMGSPDTDPAVYDEVVRFAEGSGMVAIQLHKEQSGYILNSLLIPMLTAAVNLFVSGVADPATIDKTWRTGTLAPIGPFQNFDIIGLNTVYQLASTNPDPAMAQWAEYIKVNYLDKGKLGVETGEGFYTY